MHSKTFQERVEEVCQDALDRAPSERAAFLCEACRGEWGLRAEVESLLGCEDAANQFMETLAAPATSPDQPSAELDERPTVIGSYEVLSVIGAGGMGRVYRARDRRLAREVAIKVLPAQSLPDYDSRVRFEHEARTLAALNHPNIAAIYGVEDFARGPALILELVEGDTLADRLARTAARGAGLPLSQALDIARQIADAMEAAHEKGIVHRDLKPANIAITAAGTVKVLDFGIASSLDTAFTSSAGGSLVTTRERVIVGTPAYMSPEQAQGLPVDKRSDIWAFGCVLYEMLTGTRAFTADTASSTLAAVMTGEPDWGALPNNTPRPIHRLLRWCLAKDRKRRLADIADARLDLEDAATWTPAIDASHVSSGRRLVALGMIVLVTATSAILATTFLRSPAPPPRPVRFEISLPLSRNNLSTSLALSPDGAQLAFVAPGQSGEDVLWVRQMDALEAMALPGTENAYAPFWSPDSSAIAFFASGQLKRVPVSGGPVQTLCEVVAPAASPSVGTWNSTGDILFSQTFGPLHRVSADGGTPRAASTIDGTREEFGHYAPLFLPDGEHFLYWANGPGDGAGLYVGSLQSDERVSLRSTTQPSAVTANGTLLFVENSVLKTQSLDLKRLQLTGTSNALAEGVASVSAANVGTIAYRQLTRTRRRLTWFDRKGRSLGTVGSVRDYQAPALSPDERAVAVGRDGDIWLIDTVRGSETRLTTNPQEENFPIWSPDGRQIVFMRGSGLGAVIKQPANGVGADELISQSGLPFGWSQDGSLITLMSFSPTTFADLFVLPLTGAKQPVPFLQSRFQEGEHVLSPDGRWMAYAAGESGRPEVYLQTFPSSGRRWTVSTRGGAQPQWRRDGKELFYLGLDGRLMAVTLGETSELNPGIPAPLFETKAQIGFVRNSYVPTADGQRFLVNEVEDGNSRVVFVLHAG